ncbi:hypothetical protein AHF37_07586 [Paragonimus kellicotti]|nr:hypothetical protein AHF37_07586 [Paragonimus kellicotti]
MKELEQENTSFSRRYSLASSPTSSQPIDAQGSNDSKLYASKHDNHSMKISPNKENGFISAQWAAELNKDAQIVTQRGPTVSTTQASSPPAFLGAGDACMSPPTSPQPPTPSLGLLQQTEAGLWCVTHNSVENASTSPGPGNGYPVRQRIEVGRSMSGDGQPTSTRLLPEAGYKNGPAVKSPPREHCQYPGASTQLRSANPDSNQSITFPREGMERSQIKKLVVRIFRPDRTTKAIMIDEQMTAGEIASMLIEKNFLKPSTSLAVVEKVPALKIERVFEEHDKVSECILSWPTGSQNMIFFEDRKDHFGFIESPKFWFGEEFAEVYGYNSADAVQSTDLIRILVLDSPLQLYTTTGGWSRLRAPTPHGFAFKPYSAQDTTSKHVFCFCATDEKALRNWICRLRIAKFGRQLFTNYQNALTRVQRQIAIRHAPPAGLYNMNGSLSAYIQRKSSFDILTSSTSTVAITPAESASSLTLNTGSPSIPKKFLLGRHQQPDSRQLFEDPRFGQVTNRFALENERPVSPLLLRSQQPTTQATSQNKLYPIGQPQMTNSTVDRGLTSRTSYALPQTVIAGSQTSTSGSYQPDRKPTTINYV